jgi:hypothetical protein
MLTIPEKWYSHIITSKKIGPSGINRTVAGEDATGGFKFSTRISCLADGTTAIWELNATNQKANGVFVCRNAQNSAKAATFNDCANN